MVRARDKIKIYRNEKSLEVTALFDTGSGGSYLSHEAAENIGYEKYPKPIKVPLAVKGKEAEVIGRLHGYIEIAGYKLPEEETLGVIKDLFEEAVIGRNIIEKYEMVLEEKRIAFRRYPPTAILI